MKFHEILRQRRLALGLTQEQLAQRLGATLKRIDIGEAVKVHFRDIGQD